MLDQVFGVFFMLLALALVINWLKKRRRNLKMMKMPKKSLLIICSIAILALIGTGLAIVILKPTESIPIPIAEEPDKHRQAREQITVFSQSWGGGYLEWYLVRIMPSEDDQLTCMYFLIFPSKGWKGDIEGIMEIYSREEDRWSEPETVKIMVCEYTRLTWAQQQIKLSDGRIFEIPQVMADDVTTEGYVTFRVDVE